MIIPNNSISKPDVNVYVSNERIYAFQAETKYVELKIQTYNSYWIND